MPTIWQCRARRDSRCPTGQRAPSMRSAWQDSNPRVSGSEACRPDEPVLYHELFRGRVSGFLLLAVSVLFLITPITSVRCGRSCLPGNSGTRLDRLRGHGRGLKHRCEPPPFPSIAIRTERPGKRRMIGGTPAFKSELDCRNRHEMRRLAQRPGRHPVAGHGS